MSSAKHFYVGVKGVIVNPSLQKALILSRLDQHKKRFWDIPGGRIEGNEHIEEALKRELQEEVGYINEFKIKELLQVSRLSTDLNDGFGLILLFYKVESTMEEVKLSEEHDEYRWVSLEDLKELDTEHVYIESGYLKALTLALR